MFLVWKPIEVLFNVWGRLGKLFGEGIDLENGRNLKLEQAFEWGISTIRFSFNKMCQFGLQEV